MAILRNGEGINQPIFVRDYGYVDISTEDFDPITTLHDWKYPSPLEMHASRQGMYMKKGFLARPNADGNFYAITLAQYKDAGNSFTDRAGNALEPQLFLGAANEWIECPLAKVFASDDACFANTATAINVGEIL